MTPRPDSMAARVLSDPSASYWLKDAVRALVERDACDALNDAEALREIARDHYQIATGRNQPMKTRKGREGAALRELCAALEAAAVAGGETIGVSDGMIPLACGVTLAARIDNDLAWSVRWVPCEASNPSTVDEYGRTVGAVELLINGGLSSSHPVRRQPVR